MNSLLKILLALSAMSLFGCANTPSPHGQLIGNDGKPCQIINEGDKWITIADNPQWGTALTARLMGVQNISTYVTGGAPFTSNVYDWNGRLYFETKNQNNETIKVVSAATGCLVGVKEFHDRKIYFQKIQDAPGQQ